MQYSRSVRSCTKRMQDPAVGFTVVPSGQPNETRNNASYHRYDFDLAHQMFNDIFAQPDVRCIRIELPLFRALTEDGVKVKASGIFSDGLCTTTIGEFTKRLYGIMESKSAGK